MPIYEYECTACRVRFERSQRVHDAPVETCPECGGATRRVFHPVGVIFKGSGFYVTDNRKPSTPVGSSSSGKGDGDGNKGEQAAPAGGAAGAKGENGAKAESKTGVA